MLYAAVIKGWKGAGKMDSGLEREFILEARDLEKSYHAEFVAEKVTYPVLKGVTFQIEPQEFVGVMGRSGCGKTTLLKILGMLHRPDAGTCLYGGVNMQRIHGDVLARIRRKEVAFIFQDFHLMDSLTVRENIMLPLILNEDDYRESLQAVTETAGRFGIEPLLDKKPYALSGGEKQRTAICRAMVMDPKLILADEPTGNLDSKSSDTVIESLVSINREMGKTIIIVTHDPQIASYCGRILFLKDGLVLEDLKRVGDRQDFYQEILKRMIRL